MAMLCVWGGRASAGEVPSYSAAGAGEIVDGPLGRVEKLVVSADLASNLLKATVEASVRIADWPVAPGLRRSVLVTRHDVYDPGARIVAVEGDQLVDVPRSPLVFFWGAVEGEEGGSVVLTVDPRRSTIEGASETALGGFRLVPDEEGFHLLTRAAASVGGACGVSCEDEAASIGAASGRAPLPRAITVLHTASVAVDTDNELLSVKFGNNTTAAVDYMAQLFVAMNVMYERDLLVRLLQGFTILRPSTAADPYNELPGIDNRATNKQLEEFRNYWVANFGAIKRAVTTLISGKQPDASTSGVAWVSAPCATQGNGAFNFNQVYSSPARPAADDAREVGHEIGHNFGTRHTHCPPHSPFADQCWSGESTGCFVGATSCPAPQTYSGIAGVRGTVMSWCDRRPEQDCPVTNVFHPATIAIIQPYIEAAAGGPTACIFPFSAGVPRPVSTSVNPPIGPIAGGTSVTITGTGFQAGASVTFADATGATPLTSVSVVNTTTITGTTGAHPAGVVDVVVSNPDQQSSSLTGGFTYRLDPTITGITPNGGPSSGGTQVTVMGAGFVAPATLTIGGVPATSVIVLSPTVLSGVTGAHAVGIVDVTVGLQAGLSGTLPGSYFYTPVMAPVAFYTLPPCRLVDTRDPAGPLGGPALAAASARTFDLAGVCGIPAGAMAVSVNLTVVQPTSPGFLTVYPADGLAPLSSSLNFSPGQVRANNAVLVLATDGSARLTVFNGSNGTTHFILDVNGTFQ